MKITDYTDSLVEEYLPEEQSLVESKEDQQRFINKFGMDTYNNFLKAKDRLKNKGYSTDLTYYCKHMEKDELIDLLSSLYDNEKDAQRKRIVQGKDKEIRGEYNYLGERDGYKVYQPLDHIASMDLGVNTGWCTAGRYKHPGHPEYAPSASAAKNHWNEYTSRGVKFYYFLDANTMYGKYALAIYPKTLKPGELIDDKIYVESTNFELFNDEDKLEFEAINKLPVDLTREKLIYNIHNVVDGLVIIDNIVIKACTKIKEATIPAGVTSIGMNAFKDCKSLTSITITDSVTNIDDYAFYNCSSLTSLTIPDSVTNIESSAFEGCTSLTNIKISNSIKTITEYTFSGCSSLTSVTIPNTVTSIGDHAFDRCKSLENITIPDSVISIGYAAFAGCSSLKSTVIPDSVRYIGHNVFLGCSLTVYTDNSYVTNFIKRTSYSIEVQPINAKRAE